MNFSSLIGIVLAIAVCILSVVTATEQWKVFADWHAALIVFGGTAAAALLSFSGKKIIILIGVFRRRVMGKNDEIYLAIEEIVDLSKGVRDNENYLNEKATSLKTAFLREAVQLTVDGGIEPEELDRILMKRATVLHHRYEEDAEIFKALSKFPPAFGLMGAVIGMIAMMQNLGGADAMSGVGPALAVALVATLYGIALANFVFLPLGENLTKVNRMDHIIRLMVIDGMKLIRLKKHPLVVEESIRSYLIPSERKPPTESKAA